MVDALGVTGFEGVFRATCESTMRLLRQEKDSLVNVLTTFVYDPLTEWAKNTKNSSNEEKNMTAMHMIQQIEKKLKGIVRTGGIKGRDDGKETKDMPLSIEGQVHHLILEATSNHNLCQMYIGWAAYL